MKLTFLGTGTSTGVPSIGCECETCISDDPRDKRLRVSIIIEHAGRTVLVDTSADFRQQALRFGLKHLDAVLDHSLSRRPRFWSRRHSPAEFSLWRASVSLRMNVRGWISNASSSTSSSLHISVVVCRK